MSSYITIAEADEYYEKRIGEIMEFKSYQHVEKLSSTEVEGLLFGEVYVFPKIDGSNGSVWNENGEIKCGSRRRELTLENDNHGFMKYILEQENIKKLLTDNPNMRLYGEWLIPHTVKTYQKEAWRNFYVFDVMMDDRYLSYEEYSDLLCKYDIEYLVPIRIIINPSEEQLIRIMEENTVMIKDGEGVGEGIVCKNYDFINKYGRVCWGKMTTSDFKNKHRKKMGAPVTKGQDYIEVKIIEDFLTDDIIDKVYENIVNLENGWTSKFIPRLLQTVFYDLIREHSWDFIKKNKNPIINFKVLHRCSDNRVKNHKRELFQ